VGRAWWSRSAAEPDSSVPRVSAWSPIWASQWWTAVGSLADLNYGRQYGSDAHLPIYFLSSSSMLDQRGQLLRAAVGFAGRSSLLTAQKAAAFVQSLVGRQSERLVLLREHAVENLRRFGRARILSHVDLLGGIESDLPGL
jgi:hypothetical protein